MKDYNRTRELADRFEVDTTETTTGTNGYPSDLNLALTNFDTITELEECAATLKAEGYDYTILQLHKRDGWSLWNRSSANIEKGMYCCESSGEWTVRINPDENIREVAEYIVLGDDKEALTEAPSQEAEDELMKMVDEFESEVKAYAQQFPNTTMTVFYEPDQGYAVERILNDESTGYHSDTHHYRLAIEINFEE
jgi:hypothetical protein